MINWNDRFAGRTALMKRSTVRELLKLIAQPGMISFAGGLPAAELFPVEEVRKASEQVLSTLGGSCLQYSETEGVAGLRDHIANAFSRPGYTVNRKNVVIVNGSQQALDLIGRILLNQGDLILVENPTYLALLSAWRPLGVGFKGIASDDSGMQPEAWSRMISSNTKVTYVIPNYQNPQGTCMSRDRRLLLAEALHQTGQILVEDNPYGELRYEGEGLPHLFELNARMDSRGELESEVIYTGTFSKVLAPGLRLGYIVAAEAVIDKIVQAKQVSDLHTSTFSQYLVLSLLNDGVLDKQIPILRREYRRRRDVMLQSMQQHFPSEMTWTHPQGGMFLLARLPEHMDAGAVLKKALEQKVAFVPGNDFFLEGSGKNTMRLNFSYNPDSLIQEGIRRLGKVIRECLVR